MKTRIPIALAASSLSLLFLAGCSSSGSSDGALSGGGDPGHAIAEPAPGAPAAASGGADGADGADGLTSRAYGAQDRAAAVPVKQDASPQAPPDLQTPSIISTGTVSLTSDDVGRARFELMKVVDEHRGQVSDEQTSTDDHGRVSRSRLVLRIPSGDFGRAMDELGKIPGTDLRSAKRSSEDVTTQVIDTDVRIRAQKASIDRIEALLARAKNLRSIIWIESQLSQRQADLDSLEQQRAYLADQTSMSTVTVYLERTPAKAAPKPEDASGFGAGLSKGWHALTAAGTAAATALGTLLPFAVLLALLGIPLWWVTRGRIRPRVP